MLALTRQRRLAPSILVLAMAAPCFAHGGVYRGPEDIVPPGAGGSGRTPGPRGPATPGPNGPSTPGSNGASTPGTTAPTTGRPGSAFGSNPSTGRAPVGADLSRWQLWWEFNKELFINLKEAIHSDIATTGSDAFFMGGSKRTEGRDTLKPDASQVVSRVLPALKRALDSTDDRDITSSCLIAIGKIGRHHDTFNILDVIRPRLRSPDQEIRETAAIAMGISQMREAIPDLVDLAGNTAKGRELVGRAEVDYQTRAFACYGLGLIAHANNQPDVKRSCFEALREVLGRDSPDRNVPVAAINGIRLVRPNPEGSDKDRQLLADCLDTLWAYYGKELGSGKQLIQAHVPPAIAQLLARGGDKTGKYKDAFAKELTGDAKRSTFIYQSAAVALGMLCQPPEVDKDDSKYSDALLGFYHGGKDAQARYFSLMALGKIGGERNRGELLKVMHTGKKAVDTPWAALALGVLAFYAGKNGAEPDTELGRALQAAIADVQNPETRAAIAIALGLARHRDAADDLRALLQQYKSQDELAGYLCIALALMGDPHAVEPIHAVVESAARRPELMRQAAIALGKLGDKAVAVDLQRKLVDRKEQNLARLSAVASALGFIGDSRTIDPLLRTLFDTSLTPLSRAFAAVALGGVSDKEDLPWNAKIAADMNYRAAVETLVNGSSGILELL